MMYATGLRNAEPVTIRPWRSPRSGGIDFETLATQVTTTVATNQAAGVASNIIPGSIPTSREAYEYERDLINWYSRHMPAYTQRLSGIWNSGPPAPSSVPPSEPRLLQNIPRAPENIQRELNQVPRLTRSNRVINHW